MKDYIQIKKRTLIRVILAMAFVLIGFVLWYAFFSSGSGGPSRKIVVHSYNILKADGVDVLYFRGMGGDSVFMDIALNSDSIQLGTEPLVSAGNLHSVVRLNKEKIRRRIEVLDSIVSEMKYYLDVHNVQEEGYDMVAGHKRTVERRINAAAEIENILERIDSAAVLEIKHVSVSMDEDSVTLPPVFMEDGDGVWQYGVWLRTVRQGRGVARDRSGHVISGMWNDDTLTYGRRTEAKGTYHGQFDTGRCASGHGNYTSEDGSFYEGHWAGDVRDGFGFAVNTGQIRAGEWSGNVYRGERMNYTSERIYGIDISRYQHGKGRRYYPIYWNKLRITHLGNMSRKQVTGKVDYPVSFVYIKSTEGVSVRNRFYAADYHQARKYGICCGAYHFFSTKSGAAEQAKYFIKNSYFRRGDFPPVLDVEPTDGQIMKMGGEEALFKAIRTWMALVRQHTGVRPVLYVNQTFVNRYLSKAPDIKHDYDVWIARYGEYRPDVRLVYWQLSPDGRVDGIHGDVDINVFNGYQDRFDLFLDTERIK